MTFGEALKKLGIEEYGERIFNSNSHGELFHLQDYIHFAQVYDDETAKLFQQWFVATVTQAEQVWERPESIFQHLPRMMEEQQTRIHARRGTQR